MAARAQSRNLFGWLTKKRETYRRHVGKERTTLRKQHLDDLRYARDKKRLEAEVARADKAGEKAQTAIEQAKEKKRAGSISEAQFAAMKARMDAEIRKQEEHKRAALAKLGNPAWGFGVYSGPGSAQLAHFKTRAAAETYARSHGVKAYQVKRAFAKNPAVSGPQYRMAQAVLSGTARETRMSRKVAQEIVDRTPAKLRSEFSSKGNPYQVRFIKPQQVSELVNLYHLARVPLSGTGKDTRYDRMVWASGAFHKEHPEVSSTGAYKDLDGLLARNPKANPGELFDKIRSGSRVAIVNRFGQVHSGRAVMRGPAGWVLNMGGRYGTPDIATPQNVVRVTAGRKNPGNASDPFEGRGPLKDGYRVGFTVGKRDASERTDTRAGQLDHVVGILREYWHVPAGQLAKYREGYNQGYRKGYTGSKRNAQVETHYELRDAAERAAKQARESGKRASIRKSKSGHGYIVVERTNPAKQRSAGRGAASKKNAAGKNSLEYNLGYSLGQRDRETASRKRTNDELKANFLSKFDPRRAKQAIFFRAYFDGYKGAKNPNGEYEAAAELSEKFHGAPANEVEQITQYRKVDTHRTKLGDLVSLVIDTPTGKVARLTFDLKDPEKIVRLSARPEKDKKTGDLISKQLYFDGGDQEVNLKALGMDSPAWVRDHMELGRLHRFPKSAEDGNLTYRTRKQFHNMRMTDYYHKTGQKEDGPAPRWDPVKGPAAMPILTYDYRNKRLGLAGGTYYIDAPGIIN